MKIKLAGRFGFLQIPELVALLLFVAAICLAKFSLAPLGIANGEHERGERDHLHYMPVAVERGEADQVNHIEEEWNDRLTYPTGIFDPAWLRNAADVDRLISSAIWSGIPFAALVFVAPFTGHHSLLTVLGAHLYFWGRLGYFLAAAIIGILLFVVALVWEYSTSYA